MTTTAQLKGRASLNPRDFTRGINVMRRQLRTFARDVGRPLADAARNVKRLSAALIGLGAAGSTFGAKKAFDFETMTTQFEMLYRNTDKARQHVKAMADLSAVTPFDVEPFIQASRLLQTMGGEALNNKKFITSMGDAAAMAGQDVQQVAEWIGRTYASLKSGSGAGRGARMLTMTGILGPEEQARLKELGKDTANFGQAWQIVLNALDRAKGSMDRMSKTGNGLFSTLKGLISLGFAETFAKFGESVKNVLYALNTQLQTMREDGTLEKIGVKIGNFAKTATNTIWRIVKAWQNLNKNTRSQLKSIAAVLAIFGTAWATGFVQPFITGIMRAVLASKTGFALMLAGLTGLGAAFVGYKIGVALEETFGLSDILADFLAFTYGILKAWNDLFGNLGAIAVHGWDAVKAALFGGEEPSGKSAVSKGLLDKIREQFSQFDQETDQIAADIKRKWQGLEKVKLEGGGAKTNGKTLVDNLKKQFSPGQIKKDLKNMADQLQKMLPASAKSFISEFKKLSAIHFPDMPKNLKLDDAVTKANGLAAAIQKATMPIRGKFTGFLTGGVENVVRNTLGVNADPANAETARNTAKMVELQRKEAAKRENQVMRSWSQPAEMIV